MKLPVGKLVRSVVGDYQYWRLFRLRLSDPVAIGPDHDSIQPISQIPAAIADDGLRGRSYLQGSDSQGFGYFIEGELAAVQWYWWGARYAQSQRLPGWQLPDDAAKSVDLYTVPRFRGRGLALQLKRVTPSFMARRGFHRLYSRIWHSHTESIHISLKTGWTPVGAYLSVAPLGVRIRIRTPGV